MILVSIAEVNFLVQIHLKMLQYLSRVYLNGPYMPPYFFFFGRTSFPEGASSLPLRDIPQERQLKSQTKNKLISLEPPCHTKTNHQNFKTVTSQYTYFTFTVQLTFSLFIDENVTIIEKVAIFLDFYFTNVP